MTDFRGNIDHWIRQSEPDYYLYFLKAWIPFNAWYVAELPHLKNRDAEIIKELQNNTNSKPKKIIENFLSNDNYQDQNFRAHLAELHYYLERTPITHNGRRLSFKNLTLATNPKKFAKNTDLHGNVYKTEKTSSYFQAFIEAKSGKVLLDVMS